jgi:hypothetical protein
MDVGMNRWAIDTVMPMNVCGKFQDTRAFTLMLS